MFGQKPESRLLDNAQQLSWLNNEKPPVEPEKETITYTRTKGLKTRDNAVNEQGLRFDESVPVQEIRLKAPELEGDDKNQFVVIDEKITCRLAQRPASYVVQKTVSAGRFTPKRHND